jgi:hypothetical protein
MSGAAWVGEPLSLLSHRRQAVPRVDESPDGGCAGTRQLAEVPCLGGGWQRAAVVKGGGGLDRRWLV